MILYTHCAVAAGRDGDQPPTPVTAPPGGLPSKERQWNGDLTGIYSGLMG